MRQTSIIYELIIIRTEIKRGIIIPCVKLCGRVRASGSCRGKSTCKTKVIFHGRSRKNESVTFIERQYCSIEQAQGAWHKGASIYDDGPGQIHHRYEKNSERKSKNNYRFHQRAQCIR